MTETIVRALHSDVPKAQPRSDVSLQWLVRLRFGAAALQSVLLGYGYVANEAWSFGPAVAVIAAVLMSNLVAQRLRARWVVFALLVLDTLALGALLAMTGGVANPFSVFFVVNVALAAVMLSPARALVIWMVSAAAFAVLFVSEGPPAHHHGTMDGHLRGMWIAYTLAAFAIAYFVARVSSSLRAREKEVESLTRFSELSARLLSVGALAGTTAHELSTPLGTIVLLASELEAKAPTPRVQTDAAQILEQALRCKGVLQRLAVASGQPMGEALRTCTLLDLQNAIAADLGTESASVRFTGFQNEAIMLPLQLFSHCTANLVRNALRAERENGGTHVDVVCELSASEYRITVRDRGPGISAENLHRLGEPFFSTQPAGIGMGLGVYAAASVASHLGGRLQMSSDEGAGTTATLIMPR